MTKAVTASYSCCIESITAPAASIVTDCVVLHFVHVNVSWKSCVSSTSSGCYIPFGFTTVARDPLDLGDPCVIRHPIGHGYPRDGRLSQMASIC